MVGPAAAETSSRLPDKVRAAPHAYGFNALLRGKLPGGLRSLHAKDELPRLVAWYGR